jgi:hypothetical protein
MTGTPKTGGPGTCGGCGEATWLLPLHGEKGGPLRCFMCAGQWNAIHGRQRRAARVVINAIRAYEAAGGRNASTLVTVASAVDFGITLPGYEDMAGILEVETDITTELLDDAIALCHPDKHPAERKEQAQRVTQQLIAIRPFVFPAPKPKEHPKESDPRDGFVSVSAHPTKEPSHLFPCSDCADATPYFYCDSCRAEWDKRTEKEAEAERQKRRKQYRARKERLARRRQPITCPGCRGKFKQSRADQRYCSAACKQRHYRRRHQDGRALAAEPHRAVIERMPNPADREKLS